MLDNVKLTNFKSHKETSIDCRSLTVFCGSNGVGKSSVFQALLLLRESFLENSRLDYLNLKSNAVVIGTVNDLLYQLSETDIVSIDLRHSEFSYSFNYKVENDLTKSLIKRQNKEEFSEVTNINLFQNTCQYISAARSGPQKSYPKDDVVVEMKNQISVNEGRAEYFLHFLESKIRDNVQVLEILRHTNLEPSNSDLKSNLVAWETEISSGVDIEIQDVGTFGYELIYNFRTGSELGKIKDVKSSNVGFGLTYVLPILVAILSAPKGALLFIENPEAHLHPAGQASLARLMCLAAQAGIQLFIETHSDHIINGILVNSKEFEEGGIGIDKEKVSIYHFDRNFENHATEATKIEIHEGGKIVYPPKGFFDQFTLDRKRLMGF